MGVSSVEDVLWELRQKVEAALNVGDRPTARILLGLWKEWDTRYDNPERERLAKKLRKMDKW